MSGATGRRCWRRPRPPSPPATCCARPLGDALPGALLDSQAAELQRAAGCNEAELVAAAA
ncbi:hypothetical protein [Cyanobium gracile]|uniref:hypothetical protein n=1 Tax=Cyanobium gracile TaxID=59930 RepID=UPI0012EA1108|nr:hypothetical protein [Cyanobium gracile]